MRLIAFVLLLAACHDHLDLGSKPHLLGKLADINLGMSKLEMLSLVPELDEHAGSDADQTSIEYAANFDHKQHFEYIIIWVARPIDDLIAAWGPGVPGSYGSDPALLYADAANGILFTVVLSSNAPTGNGFTIIATRMRALATIFDDGPNIKVFGLDVLGGTLGQTQGLLEKQGVATEVWAADPDMAKYFHSERVESVARSSTEYGRWTLNLVADETSHVVNRIEIEFTEERDDAERTLLDLFAHKWGTPTREGLTLTYPVKDHAINVELVGHSIQLVIAEPKKPRF